MEFVGPQPVKDNPYHYHYFWIQQSQTYTSAPNPISSSTDAVLDTNSTGTIKYIETFPARLCQLNSKYLPLLRIQSQSLQITNKVEQHGVVLLLEGTLHRTMFDKLLSRQ